MPQGFSLFSAIDPEYAPELALALAPEYQSIAEQFFHVPDEDDYTSLDGIIKWLPIKDTLPQADHRTGVPVDGVPHVIDAELNEHNFNIRKKQSTEVKIHRSDVEGRRVYANNPEQLQDVLVRRVLAQNQFKVDAQMVPHLLETTINLPFSVTTAWSDSNSTPLTDLRAMKQSTLGSADIFVLGENRANDLQGHPAMRDRIAQFSATDGQVSTSELEAFLTSWLGMQVIVADNRYHNTANIGLPALYSRLFDNVAWMGSRRFLRTVACSVMDEFYQDEYDQRRQTIHAYGHRYRLTTRLPEREAGVAATFS